MPEYRIHHIKYAQHALPYNFKICYGLISISFCLDLLKSVRASSCYSYLQLWLLNWIVAMQTAWSYSELPHEKQRLLQCRFLVLEQNQSKRISYAHLCASKWDSVCRQWSVGLILCGCPGTVCCHGPWDLMKYLSLQFTDLHSWSTLSVLSEVKVSHCPDATGGWRGNNVSISGALKERKYRWRRVNWVVLLRGLIWQESQNYVRLWSCFVFLGSLQKFAMGNLP